MSTLICTLTWYFAIVMIKLAILRPLSCVSSRNSVQFRDPVDCSLCLHLCLLPTKEVIVHSGRGLGHRWGNFGAKTGRVHSRLQLLQLLLSSVLWCNLFNDSCCRHLWPSLSVLVCDRIALTDVFGKVHLQLKVFHDLVSSRSLAGFKPSCFTLLFCWVTDDGVWACSEPWLIHNVPEADSLLVWWI